MTLFRTLSAAAHLVHPGDVMMTISEVAAAMLAVMKIRDRIIRARRVPFRRPWEVVLYIITCRCR